jgi:signal transduction histidine kinase
MTTLSKKKGGYQFDFEKPGDDSSRPQIIRGRTSMIEDKTGEHIGIITIMQDVTHEREIDRTKTEFVSTAAHQLRTPLASIQGFSELLATRDNMTEEEKKECFSYIHAQSVNLANIINDLLDISRIESGIGFSLNKAPCSITELIRKTVPYFQLQSKKHRFDLILSDKPTEIMADIDKLRQVLENVLSNAVKYSPNGGVIRITSAAVEDHCRISISDEGIGMTPEQIEKVFDKFYRADASNTAISGTGLGMNIVKHLVEAHGGEVRVESKYKIGTTVTVTLPMQINKTE